MSQFIVKARSSPVKLNSTSISPDDGWVMIYGFLLSELPSDLIVKKPLHATGASCPKCGGLIEASWFGWELTCDHCEFKSDWVYARYRFTWRG